MRIKPLCAALLVAISLLTYTPAAHRAAARSAELDPTCVDECWRLFSDCYAAGGNTHRCISVYRSCIAHCHN